MHFKRRRFAEFEHLRRSLTAFINVFVKHFTIRIRHISLLTFLSLTFGRGEKTSWTSHQVSTDWLYGLRLFCFNVFSWNCVFSIKFFHTKDPSGHFEWRKFGNIGSKVVKISKFQKSPPNFRIWLPDLQNIQTFFVWDVLERTINHSSPSFPIFPG